jgi:hypothetical protein
MIHPDEFILTQCILHRFYKTAQEDAEDGGSEIASGQPEPPSDSADESASPSRRRQGRRQRASRGFGLAPWLPGSVNLDQPGGLSSRMQFGPMGMPGMFGPGRQMPMMPEMPQIEPPPPPTDITDLNQLAERRQQVVNQLRTPYMRGLPYRERSRLARQLLSPLNRQQKELERQRKLQQRLAANQPAADNTEGQT